MPNLHLTILLAWHSAVSLAVPLRGTRMLRTRQWPGQRKDSRSFLAAISAGILVVLIASSLQAAGPTRPAEVRVKERAVVSNQRVRLADVAEVIDPNLPRRAALEKLDLADLGSDEELIIDQKLISVRIQLAGYLPDAVVVTGAPAVSIRTPRPEVLTDLKVEEAVQNHLSEKFHLSPDDLHVQLVSPFFGPWLADRNSLRDPRIEVATSSQMPLGRVPLTVRILDGERLVAARSSSFEIARRQTVVIASSTLERSAVVTADHVREETRYLDRFTDELNAEQVVGRKVTLPVRPGEVVTLRHVANDIEDDSPILIKPRDAVRLIARKKSLTVVVPVAEALQEGREGQLIRVRNPESNRIVTGRVVGRGEVEVPLN